ncbi:MAG: glycosyltransferase family 4 protein [Acidobacteria bacterium]|nr:glycosyltransferase family 4 protein [Acidobacteriota bacterium]
MRIGVDATCWQNARGYGRHARALLSTLARKDSANRYTFFFDSTENTEGVPAEVERRVVRASTPATVAASGDGSRSLPDMWRMSRALSGGDFDVLLFPTIYTYVPVWSRARKIVIIHDVIAERFPQLTVPRPMARLLWNTKVALGRRQADAVVTVSEYSRAGILEHFRLPPERVFVVGEASDPVFRVIPGARATPRLAAAGVTGGRLIVYVGGFSPHKNLESLVEVFARLPEADTRLILVGDYQKDSFHTCYREIRERVERLGIGPRVVFTGYLPDEDLAVLLNLATALALPSLMEGFGLPAIEAAACGCPVIATRESPLPGLLGGGGIFIDPAKPGELEAALGRVLASESVQRQMKEACVAAAGRLTWEAAAAQMMDVIHQAARV